MQRTHFVVCTMCCEYIWYWHIDDNMFAFACLQSALRLKLHDMETRLKTQDTEPEQKLARQSQGYHVSFSVSLTSTGQVVVGPSQSPTILVFRHVITNIGNAYNPYTGTFTAPIRGVYMFSFTIFGDGHPGVPTGASLHKNGEHIILGIHHQPSGGASASDGVILLLEVGDVVYLQLWPGTWVNDNSNHQTIFNGHLLYEMWGQ
uniref:C1q domain-containing protein n=1 Tax=Denticeps clupeoides TaxID=299321 RepID=A0AAY4DQ57_9TELE